MGEAKRRSKQLSRDMLAEIDKWMVPANDTEKHLIAEISALPRKRINRQPKQFLDYARMKPRECHANCFAYAGLDPEKKTSIIHGWMVAHGNYLLHSIVERDGAQTCITPVPIDDGGIFEFVADPAIVCTRTSEDKYVFTRNGVTLDMVGLRSDPETMIAINVFIKERLLAGVSYEQASRESAQRFSKK